MKEIVGDIWDYCGKTGYMIGITTNGEIRKDGKAVMGKVIALQAKERFPDFKVFSCRTKYCHPIWPRRVEYLLQEETISILAVTRHY